MRALGLLALTVVASGSTAAQQHDQLPGAPDSTIRRVAAQESLPLWRIALGPALVEEMRWLSPGRLLVGLRKDFPTLPNLDYLLVDTDSGRVIWRYARKSTQAAYSPLFAGRHRLVFQLTERNKASLAGVDDQTGEERWVRSFDGTVVFHVLAPTETILAEQRDARRVTLTTVRVESGEVGWTQRLEIHDSPPPDAICVFAGSSIYQLVNGVERLSSADGSARWSRADVTLDPQSAPVRIHNDELLLVDRTGRLVALDTATGATRWSTPLGLPGHPAFNNIYPDSNWIYVRAMLDPAAATAAAAAAWAGMHVVVAVRHGATTPAWVYAGAEPTMSNFVRVGGRLLVGTPTTLLALDTATGAQVSAAIVTTTGRLYPVSLRRFGDTVVYVSELVVAGYDVARNRPLYNQGFTPVSNETNLSGLDAAIPRLKETVAAVRRTPNTAGQPLGQLGAFANQEAMRYQNLANSYYWQGRDAFGRHDYLSAESYGSLERRAQSAERFQSALALGASVLSVAASFVQAIRTARIAERLETSIERQELFRQAILTAYARCEVGDYLLRPHRRFNSMFDDFTTVAVLHLPTGRRRDTVVSPTYMSYGLWNAVDFDRGIVIHHGIGLDPAQYTFSESRKLYPYGDIRSINTFLIAAPIRVPR